VKVEGVVISHSFVFSASRRLKFSFKSIEDACTAFPSTLVSMLELSPPLSILLLLRVGGLSRLNIRALLRRLSVPGNISSAYFQSISEITEFHRKYPALI
jgi:hypothetical protein